MVTSSPKPSFLCRRLPDPPVNLRKLEAKQPAHTVGRKALAFDLAVDGVSRYVQISSDAIHCDPLFFGHRKLRPSLGYEI
jgi:hypothetical protein